MGLMRMRYGPLSPFVLNPHCAMANLRILRSSCTSFSSWRRARKHEGTYVEFETSGGIDRAGDCGDGFRARSRATVEHGETAVSAFAATQPDRGSVSSARECASCADATFAPYGGNLHSEPDHRPRP